MAIPSRRGVVRDKRYSDALATILKGHPRAEEVINGAEWSIARDPERDGVRIGDNVWQSRLAKSPAMPAALLYYSFTPRILFMLDLRLVKEG